MNYRILFLISIIVFVSLSIANVVLSSGRIQIGTPICEVWTSPEGDRCASLLCSSIVTGGEPSGSTCYDNSNPPLPTRLSDEDSEICERRSTGCFIIPTERLACDSGNRSASYGRNCNGNIDSVTSDYFSCPISCTCPQPIGERPCRRATWNTDTCRWNDAVCFYVAGGCNGEPDYTQYPTTGCASGFVLSGGVCTRSASFTNHCNQFGGYDYESCGCVGGCEFAQSCSPVVIDVIGNGFSLTDALNGVNFDVDGDGVAERRGWTDSNSDDSWLALDRNGNGMIDGGRELFGSATSQPPPPANIGLNGFNALNEYDRANALKL